MIGEQEWTGLELGIAHRVRALEMFLADVYGEREVLGDRVVPKRLVRSCDARADAESLYWIGRCVERADDPARILDVAVHQLFGNSTVDRDRSSRLLLRVFGIDPPEGP